MTTAGNHDNTFITSSSVTRA